MAKKAARTASTPGRKPLPEEERRRNPIPIRFRDDELDLINQVVTEGERAAFIREAAVNEAKRRLARK